MIRLLTTITLAFMSAGGGSAHAGRPVCRPHGQTPKITVTQCLTRLDGNRCRLIFKVYDSETGERHRIGGVVLCGGRRGELSDPGDRRPR